MVRRLTGYLRTLLLAATLGASHVVLAATLPGAPVLVALDAEFSWPGSTSAQAIEKGILLAIDEVNAGGGVLGGRPLKLVSKDNGTVPARSIENLKEFAATPDLVAVFCGRFSPTVVEGIETLHRLQLILLDPWAAADIITDHAFRPSYTFRLSLRDDHAMRALIRHGQAQGRQNFGMLALNTTWGRSSLKAAESFLQKVGKGRLVGVQWVNWQDETFVEKYLELKRRGAQAILLVTNFREASILLQEVSRLPKVDRLPVLSHWGVSGGPMPAQAGAALRDVDFLMVQTYSFVGDERAKTLSVLQAAKPMFGIDSARALPSPVGFAHAYDLTHILALAIDRAGTTERSAVRAALEEVRNYDGLIKRYARPFTRERHDALSEADVIITRYDPDDGAILPVAPKAAVKRR
jgi:branched-chain amino acid transport system substrate-binding protein